LLCLVSVRTPSKQTFTWKKFSHHLFDWAGPASTVENDFSQAWPRQIDLSPSFCFRPTGPTTFSFRPTKLAVRKKKKRPLSHAILFIRKIKCSKKKSGKKRPHVANAYAVACKAPDTGANGCLGKETAPTPVRSPAPLLCRRRTPRPGPAPATDRAAVSPPLPAARSTISEVPLARPCTATPQPVEVTLGPGSRSCDVAMPQRARAMAFFVNV
jgi:hypothetical protein